MFQSQLGKRKVFAKYLDVDARIHSFNLLAQVLPLHGAWRGGSNPIWRKGTRITLGGKPNRDFLYETDFVFQLRNVSRVGVFEKWSFA